MIKKIICKIKKPMHRKKPQPSHINEFRRGDHRVFIANSYFDIDLEREIKWHKAHIKKLKKQLDEPHKYHRQFTDSRITEERRKHFKEHVIDSIPFHMGLLEDLEKKFTIITRIMPRSKYHKIMAISKKHKGTPEYFVYDKLHQDYYFVAEHMTKDIKKWIHLIKDKYKLSDVLLIK